MKKHDTLPEMELAPLGDEIPRETQTGSGAAGGAGVGSPAGRSFDAGSEHRAQGPRERLERYRALVGGEFKDLFTADTQRIIDQRFKETKSLREALAAQQPVLERVMSRYGVKSGDLDGLAAALEAEDARRAQAEAEAARLLEETARRAAEERERALIQNILARGARPAENGGGTQNGVTTRLDPARMTARQRDQIAQRAARGEIITFR